MKTRVYEAIADAFVAEGVDAFFVLMGDGNMHLTSALHARGVRCLHMRHEHSACSSAMSYATVRGDVGVASVTHGPGFTQIMTALVAAAQARIPLVVFAGETPIGAKWSNQLVDQGPFAAAAGVPYLAVHRPESALETVSRAFDIARSERRPVVVAMPADLQTMVIASEPYKSSRHHQPVIASDKPSPDAIKALVGQISSSRKPIVLIGRGVISANAIEEAGKLADRCGALLATTLLAKGALENHEFSLGVIGGYGSPLSHRLGKECDLMIAFGASLNTFTLHGGQLFPNAVIAQVDLEPRGLYQGLPPPDLRIKGDCKATILALLKELDAIGHSPANWRSAALANAIAASGPAVERSSIDDGTMDPCQVVDKLGEVLPADWDVVCGAGHSAYFLSRLRGREPGRLTTIRHFGAIGNGLAYAIGVAVAKPNSNVVLCEGDGGFLMHIQELETIRRHRLKILICVLNDGGFGAEIHILRAHGLDAGIAMFGREDFARVSEGFGLTGTNVSDLEQLPQLVRDYQSSDRAALLNFPISDKIRWSLLPLHSIEDGDAAEGSG